ncbi:MAG: hypothetical protein AAGF95_15290 [Chloroflexota bacterium]
MRTIQMIFVLILGLILSACQANVNLELDDNFSYLTVTMTEEEAASLIETILSSGQQSKILNPQADLREGEIYVSGEVEQQRTGQRVPGSLTMRLWVENGQLQAQVNTLDFSGWDASQEQLNNINQSLAEGLSRQASRNSQSELSQVVVRDGELAFTFKTPRRR